MPIPARSLQATRSTTARPACDGTLNNLQACLVVRRRGTEDRGTTQSGERRWLVPKQAGRWRIRPEFDRMRRQPPPPRTPGRQRTSRNTGPTHGSWPCGGRDARREPRSEDRPARSRAGDRPSNRRRRMCGSVEPTSRGILKGCATPVKQCPRGGIWRGKSVILPGT